MPQETLTETAFPRTPAFGAAKAAYLRSGMQGVNGWLIPSTALYLAGIEQAQRGVIDGGIAEIGVFQGKSFLAMAIDSPSEPRPIAADLFDLDAGKADAAPEGTKAAYLSNLKAWGLGEAVDILEGSSLDLPSNGFQAAGRRFRLFSVDGGHEREFASSDLHVAEATLVPGGVVAYDDVFNIHWLGVLTGLFDYLNAGGGLVPYALIPNKLLLTDAAHVEQNKAMLRDMFGAAITKQGVNFVGSTIDVYADVAWDVVATDGTVAPLWRPHGSLESLAAELAGAHLEIKRLAFEWRRAENHKAGLHDRLRTATHTIGRLEEREREMQQKLAATPLARLEDVARTYLPEPARRVARRVKRSVRTALSR